MAGLMNDNLARRGGLWVVVLLGIVITAGAGAYYRWSAAHYGAPVQYSRDRDIESAAGKNAPSSDSSTQAARAQQIEQSAKPVNLTPEQKQRLRDAIASGSHAGRDQAN